MKRRHRRWCPAPSGGRPHPADLELPGSPHPPSESLGAPSGEALPRPPQPGARRPTALRRGPAAGSAPRRGQRGLCPAAAPPPLGRAFPSRPPGGLRKGRSRASPRVILRVAPRVVRSPVGPPSRWVGRARPRPQSPPQASLARNSGRRAPTRHIWSP